MPLDLPIIQVPYLHDSPNLHMDIVSSLPSVVPSIPVMSSDSDVKCEWVSNHLSRIKPPMTVDRHKCNDKEACPHTSHSTDSHISTTERNNTGNLRISSPPPPFIFGPQPQPQPQHQPQQFYTLDPILLDNFTQTVELHAMVSSVTLEQDRLAQITGAASMAAFDGMDPLGTVNPNINPNYTSSEHGWVYGGAAGVSPETHRVLEEMLIAHKSSFAWQLSDLTGYCGTHSPPEFRIELIEGAKPSFQKPRHHSYLERKILAEKLAPLKEAGFVISCTESDWAANNLLAAKRDSVTGLWCDHRMCTDLRGCNSQCKSVAYHLPRITDIFDSLEDATIYSKLDLRQGFFSIPVHPDSQKYLAFWDTSGLNGQEFLTYTRLPFGVKSGPSHFTSVVEHELKNFTRQNGTKMITCVASFIDDLCVYSKTPEQHIIDLSDLLTMLKNCGLYAHAGKCVFMANSITYLGHTITPNGVSVDEAKTAALRQLPAPTDIHQVRQYMGLFDLLPGFQLYRSPHCPAHSKECSIYLGPRATRSF